MSETLSSDIVSALRYGATCHSGPGGDLAKDMLQAADEIEALRRENVALLETIKNRDVMLEALRRRVDGRDLYIHALKLELAGAPQAEVNAAHARACGYEPQRERESP